LAGIFIGSANMGMPCKSLLFLIYKLTIFARAMLQQALDIYNNDVKYQNEIARTMYKLGCAKLDDEDTESGTALVREAESMYRLIIPRISVSKLGEDDFDKLVMSWSR
jgi:hypothetical protein